MLPHKLRMRNGWWKLRRMFFPFQFSEVSEASFQKSAVTGSCTDQKDHTDLYDPKSIGKIKLLKQSKQVSVTDSRYLGKLGNILCLYIDYLKNFLCIPFLLETCETKPQINQLRNLQPQI